MATAGVPRDVWDEDFEREVLDLWLEPVAQGPLDVVEIIVGVTPSDTIFSFPAEQPQLFNDRNTPVLPADKDKAVPPTEVFTDSGDDGGRLWAGAWEGFPFTAVLELLLVVTVVLAFGRRSREKRLACAALCQRLEDGLKLERITGDKGGDGQELTESRLEEVCRRRGEVDGLVDESGRAGRCLWDAKREDLQRLDVCTQRLKKWSRRLERASIELKLMQEVKVALQVVEARKKSGTNEQGEIGEDHSESGGLPRGGAPSQPHLLTKIRAMLAGQDVVYENELRGNCRRLEAEESKAKDSLRYGLKAWDLRKIDEALGALLTLGRGDVVEEARQGREVVRSNLEGLREELKSACEEGTAQDRTSLLREVCVKAEVFNGTGLPEYVRAREALGQLRAAEREQQAVNVLRSQGITPRGSCNVYSDGGCSPVLISEANPDAHASLLLNGGDSDGDLGGQGASSRGSGWGRGCSITPLGRSSAQGVIVSRQGLSHGGDEWKGSEALMSGAGSMWPPLVGGPSVTARSLFLEWVNREELENRRACAEHRAEVRRQVLEQGRNDALLRRLDDRNALDKKRLDMEEESLRVEAEERRHRREGKEEARRRAFIEALWHEDAHFLWGLACANTLLAAATAQHLNCIGPARVWRSVWEFLTESCQAMPTMIGAASPGALVTAVAGAGFAAEPDDDFHAGLGEGVGGGEDAAAAATAGGAYSAEGLLWRMWEAVGMATGAVVWAGYESVGWVTGRALSLAGMGLSCEAWAVCMGAVWATGLVMSLWATGAVVGYGPWRPMALMAVFGVWVWGKFEGLVVSASWELLWLAPFPSLVLLLCSPAARYVERHLRPEGRWQWGRWDVRPLLMRVLPAAVSVGASMVLGAQVLCDRTRWWCLRG